MGRIIYYAVNMMPYMLCALPVILLYRWIRVHRLQKRGVQTTRQHELWICLFLLFAVGLASQTVIPKFEIGADGGIGIVGEAQLRINLIPFRIFADCLASGMGYFIINFLGNIGMFLPIGFFTALLWPHKTFLKPVGVGLLASLAIEICQLPLARGTDIDDLWLNTLGAAIGYLLFLLVRKAWPALVEKCRVRAAE